MHTLLEIEELIFWKRDLRILKELEILIDIISKDPIDSWSKEVCEKLKILLEKRMDEVKNAPPEPEKESISITKNTNINFFEILKD